jgi:predicted transcriptional regulator
LKRLEEGRRQIAEGRFVTLEESRRRRMSREARKKRAAV